MTDVEPLEVHAPWEKRQFEPVHQYAWFVRYAELGAERTLEQTSKLQGVPVALVRQAAASHGWERRAAAYDVAVADAVKAVVIDEDEALAMQYAVGKAMLRLGIEAIKVKNPAMMKIREALTILTSGTEMMRRGAGVADLKIEKDVQHRIQSEVLDLLGE